jgi:hypothetical protein
MSYGQGRRAQARLAATCRHELASSGGDGFVDVIGVPRGRRGFEAGDRRPKGTPLTMGFTMVSVVHGSLKRDAG